MSKFHPVFAARNGAADVVPGSGERRAEDFDRYILKPLFSFAGSV